MHLLLLLTLLLSPLLAGAQSVTVRGVVRAKTDHATLAGVTIMEKGTAHGTVTDVRGRFTLETTTRTPRLVVSFVGYITQELPLLKSADSVVVVLQEDSRALSEVVVVGYAAPMATRSVSSSVATVSGLSGKVAGVKVERFSRAPISPRAAGKATAMATTPRAGAGILTAGEINDFGKWTLWSGIAQTDLSDWHQHWQLSPQDRYAVQVVTDEGFPVVGATVLLKDRRDSLLWQAQSDNTGKCELWNNLFTAAAATEVSSLQALVAGKTYTVRRPTRFHDGLNLTGSRSRVGLRRW